nr:23S rRNA pseudouridine(955/2504/2580) synthase RluC [Paraphotobacterium marinum]
MSKAKKVQFITIDENQLHQRIDNFLINFLKTVPKTLIYRIIRKGEVRVNKKRVKPSFKLSIGDIVRVPPLKIEEKNSIHSYQNLEIIKNLNNKVLYEDSNILVINKPSGLAVHGGSGINIGLIESLRVSRTDLKYLELIHRIDRDTSGILMIAKKRSFLRSIQEQFRIKNIRKTYVALVKGNWDRSNKIINKPLYKNEINSVVKVDPMGKKSVTRVKVIKEFENATFIEASPITGRTHQIRVHCLSEGHPIANDNRYGDHEFDVQMKKMGLDRMFLHAMELEFFYPPINEMLVIKAPLDIGLTKVLDKLSSLNDIAKKNSFDYL